MWPSDSGAALAPLESLSPIARDSQSDLRLTPSCRSCALHARKRIVRRDISHSAIQACHVRPAALVGPTGTRAAQQEDGAGRAVVRRDLLGCIRHGADAAGAGDSRRRGAELRHPHLGDHRRLAGVGGDVVPADDLRVSGRGRQLHRGEGQPRHQARARGRGRAAHRLRADGVGLHFQRRGGHHVGLRVARATHCGIVRRRHRGADAGEPARCT